MVGSSVGEHVLLGEDGLSGTRQTDDETDSITRQTAAQHSVETFYTR
jgi:hypothetical protein